MLRRRPTPVVSRFIAALFALLVAIPAAALVVPLWPADESLQAGDRAPRDLVARRDAQYESQVLTERAREEAAAAVTPVLLAPDPAVRIEQQEALQDALEEVRTVRQRGDLATQQDKLNVLLSLPSVSTVGQSGLIALLGLSSDQFAALEVLTLESLSDLLSGPIQEATPVTPLADQLLAGLSPPLATAPEQTAFRELLRAFAAPNTQVDEVSTEQLRDDARRNAPPVVQTWTSGQTIVTEGTVLSNSSIESLRETGVLESTFNLYEIGAGALFALGLALLLGVYVYQLQPVPYPSTRRLLLIGVTILAVLVAVRLAIPPLLPDTEGRYYEFMLPVAAAAMIAAAFADLHFGAVVAVGVGLFSAFIAATAPEIAGASFLTTLDALELGIALSAAGLAGASVAYRAERLTRFAFAAVAVALAMAVVLSSFWMLREDPDLESLGWIAIASVVAGVGSAVVTVGAFVFLSLVLGVTTRLQLMELAQSNAPLLRRLQDEAPGTYHHSMMVGALAERAAEQIGADALVTRAGAYYHDIGKLAQPGYYIENILDSETSPHDALPPEESARRILDHVTNGVEIARKNRLPDIVREFIPQHHGTRLVAFFYRKAVNNGEVPDPEAFSYHGPRPKTKESAIVMLADSSEAVVRAARERSPDQISASVDAVFAERLAEGQLDDCDITMHELQVVAASFKSTLRAVYHQRIEYPAATTDEASTVAAASGPA